MQMRWLVLAAVLAVAGLSLRAADSALDSANAKLDRIKDEKTRPGEIILFTPAEVNAWSRDEVPKEVPQGIREPKVALGNGTATGSALVDFLKMEQGRGKTPGRLMSKMLEGERPLKVSVSMTSGGGKATVSLTRVELSEAALEGTILDFLIKTFFLPLYPDAKIGEPFELDYNIDRIELRPDGVRVTMKR